MKLNNLKTKRRMENSLTYDQPHWFHQPTESVPWNVSVATALRLVSHSEER